MKITIIGAGNIGGAIAKGIVKAGRVPADITVTAAHAASLEKFAALGINCSTDNVAAVNSADMVFIAVKPWIAPEVLDQLGKELAGKIVVSVCPGVKPEAFEEKIGKGMKLIYVIPNTAVEICESVNFVIPVKASEEEIKAVEQVLDGTGLTMRASFEQLPAVTALASCGIAYALQYIKASAEGGKEMGIPDNDSRAIVTQTVKGAAAVLKAHGTLPQEEIDRVTTPGGLTLKGLDAMAATGFDNAVKSGLKAGRTRPEGEREKIVVKIGSNVLSKEDGMLDVATMSSLVDQIVELRRDGYDVLIVTSGAVACGRNSVGAKGALDSVEQRQLFSAVGQTRLINHYDNLFSEYGINVGQILTAKSHFTTAEEFNNQKACIEVMLSNGVVPIINENDTVCITELMFTDNDELSWLLSSMIGASTLVILSDIDGLYDGDPADAATKVIRTIQPGETVDQYIAAAKSSRGRGGMQSKSAIAQKAAAEGIKVIIANGKKNNILKDLFDKPEATIHTEFIPSK